MTLSEVYKYTLLKFRGSSLFSNTGISQVIWAGKITMGDILIQHAKD
jgi:hypothetical protein